jgi:hypothetical protein
MTPMSHHLRWVATYSRTYVDPTVGGFGSQRPELLAWMGTWTYVNSTVGGFGSQRPEPLT